MRYIDQPPLPPPTMILPIYSQFQSVLWNLSYVKVYASQAFPIISLPVAVEGTIFWVHGDARRVKDMTARYELGAACDSCLLVFHCWIKKCWVLEISYLIVKGRYRYQEKRRDREKRYTGMFVSEEMPFWTITVSMFWRCEILIIGWEAGTEKMTRVMVHYCSLWCAVIDMPLNLNWENHQGTNSLKYHLPLLCGINN